MRFDPNEYAPVAERLAHFFEDYGREGPRVITEIVEHDRESGFVLMKASLYTHFDDAEPAATGHAYELRSGGHVQAGNYIEVAETSAVGRALANLNYKTKREPGARADSRRGARGEGRAESARGQAPPPADGAAADLRERQAKAIVEAGGVTETEHGLDVTGPALNGRSATFTLTQIPGTKFVACGCDEYKAHAAEEPGFKCVHKLARSEYLRKKKEAAK